MKTYSAQLLIAAAAFFSGSASADEGWPHFRGPTQQGHASGKVPLTWSETENVKWKTALPGQGWSSPVIGEGRIWMTTALDGGKSLRALCVDLASGKLLHDVEVFRPETVPAIHARNSYASPTPILDGERLYVHFGALGTACLSSKDGTKLWENTELKIEHQVGPGGSPTLYKDRLLIPCDGTDLQYEAALDKMTGKLLWKTERSGVEKLKSKPEDMRKAYGTPVVLQIEGQAQSLTTAAERLYAMDPATGRELWYIDYPGFSNVPAPVTDGSAAYVCTGFMKPELWAIKLGGAKGNVTDSHVLWKQKAGAPDQSSPVIVGERLYMVAGGGITSCIDTKDGRIVWKERLGGDYAASLLHASGHLFVFDSAGKCHVIKPGDSYQLVGTNQLESGLMASPAVAGDALILRTKTHLYRIEK
jgi:outer membrane protein assembly factor BamB